ncbi:MAG: MgtC/SapB family protein [Ignavibacteriales bacterium]
MPVSEEFEVLAEIALAILLGGIVGFERESAGKAAGLRTHMLVAGVSTFLVAMGHSLLTSYKGEEFAGLIRADPFRIMGAIITGLSFVGAGTIIQNKREDRIEGLTTAASLLFVGAIGIGVALQKFYLSVGCTILILIVNRMIMKLEYWIGSKVKKSKEHQSG